MKIFRPTPEKTASLPNKKRWAVLTKEVITGNGTCNRGVPMLTRYRLVTTPMFGVYVHHWHRPDADQDPHDHPWWYATLILLGGYDEILHRDRYSATGQRRRRAAGSLHAAHLTSAHRVVDLRPDTWTLLLVGPKRQDWSFYVAGGSLQSTRVPWQAYIAQGGNPDPFNS